MTDHIREKMNALNNWIAGESLQIFQHELMIEASKGTTGDRQVDARLSALEARA